MNTPTPEEAREALDKLVVYANNGWGSACPGEVDTLRRFIDAHSAPVQERQRINELLQAIREKWVASNGKDSISVSVLDTIAEVIADGSYVKAHSAPVQSIPDCKVVDVGFRWHSDTQEHIPHVLVQFTPVPANSPADAKGWTDRDAFVAMLASPPPAQPAQAEPVAFLFVNGERGRQAMPLDLKAWESLPHGTKFYIAAQPKREPLTDDDIARLAESEGWHIWHEDILREALSFGHAVVRLTLGEQG